MFFKFIVLLAIGLVNGANIKENGGNFVIKFSKKEDYKSLTTL